MQKYPRGSRGSPAKGVVWETVARVRISSSAPKKDVRKGVLFWRVGLVRTRELPRVRANADRKVKLGKGMGQDGGVKLRA